MRSEQKCFNQIHEKSGELRERVVILGVIESGESYHKVENPMVKYLQ